MKKMTIGEKIKAARKARGWTQAELADRLCTTATSVREMEAKCKNSVRIDVIFAYAEALDVDWKDLLTDDETPQKPYTAPTIEELIGTPAVLEQLAEECAELGQAALKLARKMRGENPTPKTVDALQSALTEETADVVNCIEHISLLNRDDIETIKADKAARWRERIDGMR
jgi:transcriptional regulator with XRE-family HTH domain